MDFPLQNPAGGKKLYGSELRELRRDVLRLGEIGLVSTGSANNYIVQLDSNESAGDNMADQAITELVPGQPVVFEADKTNIGPVTVTVKNNDGDDIETNLPVYKNGLQELMPGDIMEGEIVRLVFDGNFLHKVALQTGFHAVAGDDFDDVTPPVAVAINPSDNKVYPLDLSTIVTNYIGFVVTVGDEDDLVSVQTNGVVGGFTGLVEGATYFINGAGTISTTPQSGDKVVEVGVAVSDTQLLILHKAPVGIFGSNYQQVTSPDSTTTNGTFTFNLPKKARTIQFQVSLWGHYSGSGNGSRVITYDIIMDLVTNRVNWQNLFSRSVFNSPTPSFALSNGAAAPIPQSRSFDNYSSGMFASTSSGGSITRLNTIAQNANNQLEIAYTMNHNAGANAPAAIIISPVTVLN